MRNPERHDRNNRHEEHEAAATKVTARHSRIQNAAL
jgi:hypothetical protein